MSDCTFATDPLRDQLFMSIAAPSQIRAEALRAATCTTLQSQHRFQPLLPRSPCCLFFPLVHRPMSWCSREQIRKENEATGKEPSTSEAPWGIISVKAQDVDHEIPMQPITMMRNALGKEEGGSGVRLERQKYIESVEYWRDHAPVK